MVAQNILVRFIGLHLGCYSICEEIECIVKNFIWGSSNGSKKMALVNWESICQLRFCGSLGIHHLGDQNKAFLMKIGFVLLTKD